MGKPKVLVVDDMPENIEVLYHALKDECEVFGETSGTEALETVRSSHPDLILLDIMMPGMDGYEVCAALENDVDTSDIPIIFITARTDVASEKRALSGGAVDFIHKPFNTEVVRARVRLQLELAHYRRHLEDLVRVRTRELAEALDAAEAANRAKTAFLHAMSHELRTPLHQIMGGAEMLRVQPEQQRHLNMITAAAKLLQGIIEDILYISRIAGGGVNPQECDFSLTGVIADLFAQEAARARAKGLDLKTEVHPGVPTAVHGDAYMLAKALRHYIHNGVKFTGRGSVTAAVSLVQGDDTGVTLRFEVRDTGIGIDATGREQLFSNFMQVDDSTARRYEGIGLGLAIARQVARLMGGEVGVESELGKGSTFWLTARFKTARAQPRAPGGEGQPARQAGEESSAAEPGRRGQVSAPGALDRDLVAAGLNRLEALLAVDDADALEALNELAAPLEAAFGSELAALRDQITQFDFPAALDTVRKMNRNIRG